MPRRIGYEYLRGFDHPFPGGEKRPGFPDGKLYPTFEEGKYQQALFCPRCQNHLIRRDDEFCNVCKMPLYNHCLEDGKKLSLECRRCPSCGGLTAYSEIYDELGNGVIPRPAGYKNYDRFECWGYIRHQFKRKYKYLYAVLSESIIYTDMVHFILIFSCDKRHLQAIFDSYPIIVNYIETYAFVCAGDLRLYHYDRLERRICWLAPNDDGMAVKA